MKVFLLNHTATVGGAETCALELLRVLPKGVDLVVACPDGPLAHHARALGFEVYEVPAIEGSLRLDVRHTPRTVLQTGRAAIRTRILVRRTGTHLIHANSIRAGIIAALASRFAGPPVLVFVHDCLPRTALGELTRWLIQKTATMIVANSRYTACSFETGGSMAQSRVIYPPVNLERFNTARVSRHRARTRLGLAPEATVLGIIAQITPWKGQDTAIQALALLAEQGSDAQLFVVGEAKFRSEAGRYDTIAYLDALKAQVAALGVEERVKFLGERSDVPEVLRAFDLLLVPSWEEPLGLIVIEAMAMKIPVLATTQGGPPEILTNGEEGLLLEPRAPEPWARAAAGLLADHERRHYMGDRGRLTAKQFGRHRFAGAMAEAYHSALAPASKSHPSALN